MRAISLTTPTQTAVEQAAVGGEGGGHPLLSGAPSFEVEATVAGVPPFFHDACGPLAPVTLPLADQNTLRAICLAQQRKHFHVANSRSKVQAERKL